MSLLKKIIPRQFKGFKTGATAKYRASSIEHAKRFFIDAKSRLVAINEWHQLCGKKGSEFILTNENGTPVKKTIPSVGDLIRIKLPAPSNPAGDGYDWVRIEKIENVKNNYPDEQLFGFRVRPVSNPAGRSSESAHFYTSSATSTFAVYRLKNTVIALERGRNEIPNAHGNFINKLRNIVIAVPAMLGFSKPQWQLLVNGILNPPKENSNS